MFSLAEHYLHYLLQTQFIEVEDVFYNCFPHKEFDKLSKIPDT